MDQNSFQKKTTEEISLQDTHQVNDDDETLEQLKLQQEWLRLCLTV